MKLTFYELPGYYSTERCVAIKNKLEGRTFLNFQFQYGGTADNNKLSVYTDEETTEEELKEMFLFVLINEVGK